MLPTKVSSNVSLHFVFSCFHVSRVANKHGYQNFQNLQNSQTFCHFLDHFGTCFVTEFCGYSYRPTHSKISFALQISLKSVAKNTILSFYHFPFKVVFLSKVHMLKSFLSFVSAEEFFIIRINNGIINRKTPVLFPMYGGKIFSS